MGKRTDIALLIAMLLAFSVDTSNSQVTDDDLYSHAVSGDVEAIKKYLDAGGDPRAEVLVPGSNVLVSLIELTARARSDDGVLLLLNSGAIPDDPVLFIEWAAELGLARAIDLLLQQDPTRLVQARGDAHPLVVAAARGHSQTVEVLLSRMPGLLGRAELQSTLNEALVAATANYVHGAFGVIDQLLDAGADVSATTVLAGAVLKCDSQLVDMYISRSADVRRLYDAGRGALPIIAYALYCFERSGVSAEMGEAVVRSLVSAGADLCAVDLGDNDLPASARQLLGPLRDCD